MQLPRVVSMSFVFVTAQKCRSTRFKSVVCFFEIYQKSTRWCLLDDFSKCLFKQTIFVFRFSVGQIRFFVLIKMEWISLTQTITFVFFFLSRFVDFLIFVSIVRCFGFEGTWIYFTVFPNRNGYFDRVDVYKTIGFYLKKKNCSLCICTQNSILMALRDCCKQSYLVQALWFYFLSILFEYKINQKLKSH